MSAGEDVRGKVAIAGVGTFGCGDASGWSEMEILAQAAHRAVADAGLRMSDIDGLATASLSAAMWPLGVVEHLGLRPKHVDGSAYGGCAFISHILPATRALLAGECNAVLVCYGSNQRSSTISRRDRGAARGLLDPAPFESPYAPFNPPSSYALIASRHMHQYGTTRRDLAEVAVAARRWAQLNPEAFRREPLSIDEVLAAPMVSDPFSAFDCCLVTDGAGAFVLTRADDTRGAAKPQVVVMGSATAMWHKQVSQMHDLTVTPAAESGARAFAAAGLSPQDIDVVQLYDAFTINTLLFLEDLGFCAKGEGGAFVRDGAIAPGGRLPVNTNGGGLSCVHPNMYSAFAVIEAVRQLRGEAGERQVKQAARAVAHGNGGFAASSQATAVLARADAV